MKERPTVMEIDMKALDYNIAKIREKVGNDVDIMPIIKASGYGTYIDTKLDWMKKNNINIVGVAFADEGANIRKIGYEKDIFILNQPAIDEIPEIIENNLVSGVCSEDFIKELGKQKEEAKVHIEIETGMGRTGVNLGNLEDFIKLIKKYSNIKVEGIYTHFSVADTDKDYTKLQIETFNKAVQILKESFENIKYIHASASNGILNFKEAHYNLVRPGIILYGYLPYEGADIELKPIAKLKSKINFIKSVEKGASISYGRRFIAESKRIIATVPIGYADGIKRILTNQASVMIHGKKVKIVGTICMDGFMCDITDVPDVKVGDDVYIFDNENITLQEIAEKCNTINYEILSTISPRVTRKFKN